MLVDINKIGDPQGSYSVYLRLQSQFTLCFSKPRKMHHVIHLQEENVFQKHCVPNNRICHAIKDRKENFLLIIPEISIIRSIALEGNYLKLSQETMLRKR